MTAAFDALQFLLDGPLYHEPGDHDPACPTCSAIRTIKAALTASAEPVGYGYSAEIQSAPGRLLHVCRDREGVYDVPLYTHSAPDAEIVAALEGLVNVIDAARARNELPDY